MTTLTYLNTTTCEDITIDVATASLDDLLSAYNSLFEQADDGGAFPGSREWARGKKYRDQIAALVAERPEIEGHRKAVADAKRAARMAGRNPWTL